ncbi:MAG: hypothetical protein J6S67_18425 [Methanobrevibacter sp.]|nr:hypothetical protein [Methanobrevibacter sp.]
MRKKKTFFEESLTKNMKTYYEYLDRLTELAISMFEWKNLPENIDERFLELTLFTDGQAVFFKDEELDDYLALQVATNGGFNVYRIPLRRRAYAVNGYQKQLNIEDSVIIYNNMLRRNSIRTVKLYAERLANLDRIIDVNANAQKTPVLVQGSDQQKLTLLNVYKEYDGNAPVIFGYDSLDLNALTVLKTDAPYVADKIYQLKTQTWNECLTYLGISNLNIQKKERLVADEVVRNQGGTIASRYSRLNARRQACEQINKMFGLEIEVDYREDYREADDELMLAGQTGDEGVDTMMVDFRTN